MDTDDFTHGLTGVNLALDQDVVRNLWVSIVGVLLSVLLLRLWQIFHAHIRHVYCLHSDGRQQRYWSFERTEWWPWLKKTVIYAPLGSKRHNREIQLSRASNYGTLPGRIHTILLLGYVLSNVAYCLILPYGKVPRAQLIAELRGRTGMLSTVNMIPLIGMAMRNNPLISILHISFDTFNLFHRWIGRLVVIEACAHVAAWYANVSAEPGQDTASYRISHQLFLQVGLIATIAFVLIFVQSLSPIRHAFYEVFLHLHQLFAATAFIGVYLHLEMNKLPALPFIRAIVGIWIGERLLRIARLIRANVNFRRRQITWVSIEALPADACRVTFHLPNHLTIRPGSHVYAYLPRISWWQSHPFSVAWTDVNSEPPTGVVQYGELDDEFDSIDLEKQSKMPSARPAQTPTSVSLICQARSGMTRNMFNAAKAQHPNPLVLTGFMEGPYAGHDSLSSYGTVVMFAGGAGITHHLIQTRHLIARASAQTVATRKICLVWTVRDMDALIWIRPWMDEIMAMPGRKKMLTLSLYVTRPKEHTDYRSPHSTIQLFPKRCDPGKVLDDVLPDRVGATMVTVCGPGAFADEVRAAVRQRLDVGCIDMNEESFTW